MFQNKLKVNSIPLSAGQVLSDVESSSTFDTRQLATSLPLSLVCRTSGICQQPVPESPKYYQNHWALCKVTYLTCLQSDDRLQNVDFQKQIM